MFMLIIQFLILTAVVTGGVIFFLKKILHDDTESAINRLNRAYQELLKRQEELAQKIQTAEKEYTQKKEEAEQLKTKMISEAVEEARQKKDELLKTAKAEADDLVAKAHASTEKMQREIEKRTAEKTIDFAGDVIGFVFTTKMTAVVHHELIREFIDGGKNFDLSTVGSTIDKLVIKSAMALEADEREKVYSLIKNKLNREIEIKEVVDPAVIAGIVLEFGTLLLDVTLRNLLKEGAWQAKKKLETS